MDGSEGLPDKANERNGNDRIFLGVKRLTFTYPVLSKFHNFCQDFSTTREFDGATPDDRYDYGHSHQHSS